MQKQNIKIFLALTAFLLLPNFALAGEKIIEYGFEDWTGWNGNVSPAPGYIFSTSYTDYWNAHMASSKVISSCGALTPHTGNYFYMQSFFHGAYDLCINSIPAGVTAHSNIGLNGRYPTGIKNSTDFSTVLTDKIAVVRFWFATGAGWNDDIRGYRGWNNNITGTYNYPAGRIVYTGGERTGEYYESNVAINNTAVIPAGTLATSGGSNYLEDATKSWAENQYATMEVYILGGTGAGQNRTISSNTNTRIIVDSVWDVNPDSTSEYRIGFPPPSEDSARWTNISSIITTKSSTLSLDSGGGLKFIRISSGSTGEVIIRARMDNTSTTTDYPRFEFSDGMTGSYMIPNNNIDWQDGNWHTFNAKIVRNSDAQFDGTTWTNQPNNVTVTVYIDDWNMTGTQGISQSHTWSEPGWRNQTDMFYIFDNWCASYPDEMLQIAVDDLEVWNGMPDEEPGDTIAPASPSGLAVS